METTRFTAANGCEVIKVVTDSGVTGYIDASIPLGAIEALYRRLSADLRRPIAHSRRQLRQNLRRTTRPMRKHTRRWKPNHWVNPGLLLYDAVAKFHPARFDPGPKAPNDFRRGDGDV
jgi:hypothetical protein